MTLTLATVPNGGYVASVFLKAASAHLSARNQPHTITAQWTFLNRTQSGRALVRIVEAKLGRATSVLHVTLHQQGLVPQSPWVSPESPVLVAAYMTNGNLDTESGVTLPTGWTLDYPPPKADLEHLAAGDDPNWQRAYMPIVKKVHMMRNLEYHCRRTGHVLPTTHDLWLRLANGEPFTQSSLGFLADVGPPLIVESFRPASRDAPIPPGGFASNKRFWYPTLTMTLDVRRKLPDEGVVWLRLRVVGKEVRNGRYDAEVLMFTEEGELIALSNHVALAMDFARNNGKKEDPRAKM